MMTRRFTAFEKSRANPHRWPRVEPVTQRVSPALAGPSEPIPTLQELLEAVERDSSWQ